MIRYSYIVLLFIPFLNFSQNFENDMKAISQKMENAEAISIKAKVSVYSKRGGKLIYNSVSSVEHKNETTITKLDDLEIFKSKTIEIQVDYENHKMLLSTKNKVSDKISESTLKEIQKYVSSSKSTKTKNSPKLISSVNGLNTYSFSNLKGINDYTVVLDNKNHTLIKITFEYDESSTNKGQFGIIEYTQFDYRPIFNSSHFNTNNYFIIDKSKKYIPSSRFSQYNIITQ